MRCSHEMPLTRLELLACKIHLRGHGRTLINAPCVSVGLPVAGRHLVWSRARGIETVAPAFPGWFHGPQGPFSRATQTKP